MLTKRKLGVVFGSRASFNQRWLLSNWSASSFALNSGLDWRRVVDITVVRAFTIRARRLGELLRFQFCSRLRGIVLDAHVSTEVIGIALL